VKTVLPVVTESPVCDTESNDAGFGAFDVSTAFSNASRRAALLVAAGLLGSIAPADAATSFFWPDYYEPVPQPRFAAPRLRRPVRHHLPKHDEVAKDARRPQGPLIVAISIEKQVLKVYDANGYFAETPISTGMRGHPTPMGVFSVIQKHKYHRSNIYSGAPMPYMQRITWSGVAMHAGVLPGYPASHGCIRMPMNFAVKMWGWTRMGVRVVITPGEVAPESFSHPLLGTQKTAPVAAAAEKPVEVATAAKSDKAAVVAPAFSETGFQLKSTLGHDITRPAANTHTADATNTLLRSGSSLTLLDAPVASRGVDDEPSQGSDKPSAPAVEQESAAEIALSADFANATASAETAKPVAADATKDQTRPPDAEKGPDAKPPAVAAKSSGQIAVLISKKDGKLYVRQNFAPLFEVPVTFLRSDRPLGTHIFTAQADKDDANLLHWSVLSMPIIAPDARLEDDERVSRRRRTTGAIEVKPAPLPNSAAEAMDRLTIPTDAMTRINETLSTGASIIVSDQGINGGETGIGTDFIVPLR
jgi:hypothetical protein